MCSDLIDLGGALQEDSTVQPQVGTPGSSLPGLHTSTPLWLPSLPNGSAHHSDLATLEGPYVSFLCIPDPFSYSALYTSAPN